MIKRGDIIFFYENTLLGRTISLVETGKPCQEAPSHVAIVSIVTDKAVCLIEAQFGGVRQVNIAIYSKAKKWYTTMNGDRDIEKGMTWAYSQIGKKYDTGQLVGIWMRGFWRCLGPRVYEKSRKIRNYLDSRQSFICSELVEKYAEITGGRLWPSADIGQVTPYDIFRSKSLEFIERG